MLEKFVGFLIVFLPSLFTIAIGLSHKLDYSRQAYIFLTPWSNGMKFASIPLGIGFMVLSLLAFVNPNSAFATMITSFSILCAGVALFYNFFPPRFLYPDWFTWIQDNHNKIWPLLRKEARKDYRGWYRRTKSHEGLVDWVEEMRLTNGW